MYIEDKSQGLSGPTRIGRVRFSNTGKTIHYDERSFQSSKGRGFKTNFFDIETGDHLWVSTCWRDGADRLLGDRAR